MTKEGDKDKVRIIEMSLVLDAEGRVRITQDLMDALNVQPGDLLAFQIDREKDMVTVKGMKKPPYFHSDIQVSVPTMTPRPAPGTSSPEVTQMNLFETGQA